MRALHDSGKENRCLLSFVIISSCRYIELAGNERSDFKARELKSIHIDAEGIFLKLLLHKSYANRLNLYNQVRFSNETNPSRALV